MNVTWYAVQAANEDVRQYTYTSEQPPVEADEYARVCAEAADLRRQLAECREDKDALRLQVAAIEHFANDCWAAGAYQLPMPQWEHWIATRR